MEFAMIARRCLLALALAAAAVTGAPAQAGFTMAKKNTGWLDSAPRTAIITAFEPEWVALEGAVQDRMTYRLNGLTILTGTMAGHQVVLLQSGVSMVNAAMNTQLVIDRFNIRRIVFSGIAGGIDPALSVGDVVVADQWAQYMEVSLGRKQGDQFISPDIYDDPDHLSNYGMMIPRTVRVGNAGEPAARHRWFHADPALLALAQKSVGGFALERCLPANEPIPQTRGISAEAGRCLDHQPRVSVGGNGISGPAFADNAEYREYLYAQFKAQVLDMETAATAHVAYANQVPFIGFRSLSDLAGGDSGPNQSWVFGRLAARNAATVVQRFVAALPD
jgi:adenosylhomocysteine nucleosidase